MKPHNEIPDHLQEILWQMENETYALKNEGYVWSGWVPQRWIWDEIQDGEDKGIISPGQKVLELGSGNGSVLMVWAYKGYDVTGIEISRTLVEYSIDALSKHRDLLANPKVRIIEGSYYPEEYIEYRKTNPKSKKIDLERKILQERGYGPNERTPFFYLDCIEDVYTKNNISLSDFDVIYAYMWDAQIPSVAEVFKKYAKRDAVLFLVTDDSKAQEIAPLAGLKQHPKSYHFYTKR